MKTAAAAAPAWRGLGAVAVAAILVAAAGLAGRPARAQQSSSGSSGTLAVSAAVPGSLPDVRLEQRRGVQVSLNTLFRDETGKTVPLGTYFGSKPVLLVLPFYKCPGVCAAELDGMAKVFQDPLLKFRVGREFEAVTVSIDQTEGADLAAMKKREYMKLLGQPNAAAGWHFLTGDEASIKKLAAEVGFHYAYDEKTKQFAHPAGLILLTGGGKVSKYFYGVDYNPTDLRLAVTDAGQGKVGSLVDQIALYCCTYDPQSGTYSVAIFRMIQVAAAATVVLLAGFMAVALRRDFGAVRS